MTYESPRRCDIQQMKPAELAIREAIIAVEALGCDPVLSDAVCLLLNAKNQVSNFIDAQEVSGDE